MDIIWQCITTWAARHSLSIQLNPGASQAEIARVEQALGLRFTDDFRAWLLIHDGEDWQQGIRWLENGMRWLPVAQILEQWQIQQTYYARWGEEDADDYQDEDRIRNVVYHPKRIPIAESDADAWLWLDFTPGPAGIAGQVITSITECDFIVLGSSFRAFLARYAELLETGVYYYDAETYAQVIPQNLAALHSGAVRQADFYRRLFPLEGDITDA